MKQRPAAWKQGLPCPRRGLLDHDVSDGAARFRQRLGGALSLPTGRFWVLVLLLGHVLFFASSSADAATSVRVRLKWLHQFQFAGIYAAIEQGYYREAGLEVELQEARADESAVAAVLRGEADFGIHGADLVVERARNKPVVALAVIMQHSPMVVLSRRDAGIDHLHDLAGKRLLLGPDAAELLAYLKSEGVPVPLGLRHQSFDLQALIAGEVDAMPGYSTDETWLLEQAGLPYNQFSPRSAGLDFYGDTLFTTEAFLRDHPRQVRAFTTATLRGWRYALSHREEMVRLILQKYSTRHAEEHLHYEAEQTRRLMTPELVEIGHMQEGRWRHVADSFAELGMMPTNFSLEGFLLPAAHLSLLQRLARWLTMTALLAALTLFLLAYFLRLNFQLRKEIRERAAVEQQLRASEQRARELVESAPFPVLIVRRSDGSIRFINRRCEEYFGVRGGDLQGQQTLDFYVNPADRATLLTDVATEGRVLDRELHLRNHKGQTFWGLVSVALIEYTGEEALFVTLNDISERKALELELQRRARTDMLTGLANRGHFLERLETEIARAQRHGHSLALLALDLDHFKQVNDSHGHAAGDSALRHFAMILKTCLRTHDLAGRLGGEEFMAVLPETGLGAARQVAERIRDTLAAAKIHTPEGLAIAVTVSIGVSALDESRDLNALLHRVDQALYAAKDGGRNRVVVLQPGELPPPRRAGQEDSPRQRTGNDDRQGKEEAS